jgi:transcriptional regulator with XRE-family HTH domain
MRIVSKNIKLLREFTGLTAEKFGAKFKLTKGNIESYEQDRGAPDALAADRICKYFNLTVDQLFNQKLTPEDLEVTGMVESVTEVKLRSALKEIKHLKARLEDKEAIIELMRKGRK